MDFIKHVQDEKITEPTRRGFRLAEWRANGEKLRNCGCDDNLIEMGVWIHERLGNVRNSLRFIRSEEHNWSTKVTALAAVANRDCIRLAEKISPTPTLSSGPDRTYIADELSSIRFELGEGGKYHPNEVLQAIIDGVQIPIKFVLNGKINNGEMPKINRANWDDVGWDMNAGNAYFCLESLWDDCLWNDYVFESEKDNFFCINENRMNLKVVSEHRRDMLVQQFFHLSHIQLQRRPTDEVQRLIGIRPVTGISKDGRRHKYEIGTEVKVDDLGLNILIARAFAQEEYYLKLLTQSGNTSKNLNLQVLLNCWHVIRNANEVHWSAALRPEGDWNIFCPGMQLPALYTAVSSALGVSLGVAREAVNFFVYRGSPEQSLWTQPLVWVGREKVVPMFGPIRYSNLNRCVDIWMRQLGLDLSERGAEFEKYVRSEVKILSEKSPISSSIKTIENSFVFRPKGAREEEIDLVFTVDNVVFIGEVKCFLQPAEAKEFGRHWNKVIEAVVQVKRKADSVNKHRSEFIQALNNRGISVTENFEVLPILILNGPIHVGALVHGVPVADMTLLRIYFDGEVDGATMVDKNGKINVKQVLRLYKNVDEAKASAKTFFEHPVHLQYVWENLALREVPVIGMKDGVPVKEATYQLKEIKIDFEAVQRKLREQGVLEQ